MKRAWVIIFLICLFVGLEPLKVTWAAQMPTGKVYTNSIGMKFVRIPRQGSCGDPGTDGWRDGRTFTMSKPSAEPKGYLSVCQGRNGIIHLIGSWNHYAFNLKWLETPPPSE